MKRLIVAACLFGAVAVSCGNAEQPKGHLVTETYIVQQGDTLWTISPAFMAKNTHGPREIREFCNGIIELNYDRVFAGRERGLVIPGDQLKINYWEVQVE